MILGTKLSYKVFPYSPPLSSHINDKACHPSNSPLINMKDLEVTCKSFSKQLESIETSIAIDYNFPLQDLVNTTTAIQEMAQVRRGLLSTTTNKSITRTIEDPLQAWEKERKM